MEFGKRNLQFFLGILVLIFVCQLFSGTLIIPLSTFRVLGSYFTSLKTRDTKHTPPSISYNSMWYDESYNHIFLHSPAFAAKCPLCRLNYSSINTNDTPRDLVITAMFNTTRNLIPFIRSLRSTQSKATVVVLTDRKTLSKLTLDALNIAKHCEMNFIVVGETFYNEHHPGSVVFYHYVFDFLYNHINEIDRVIIVDFEDTAFQGNPFTKSFKDGILYLIQGYMRIGLSSFTKNELQALLGNQAEAYFAETVIESDHVLGNVKDILIFLDLLISVVESFPEPKLKLHSQAFFNYIVHSGILTKNNISYVANMPNEIASGSFGQLQLMNTGFSADIVHQIKSSMDIRESLYQSCPRGSFKIPNYITALTEERIKELEEE